MELTYRQLIYLKAIVEENKKTLKMALEDWHKNKFVISKIVDREIINFSIDMNDQILHEIENAIEYDEN